MKINNICCIGAGYVGGPTMAVISDKCKHLNINVVDISQKRINDWNNKDLDKLPIFEPGLKDIISRRRNKNLFFSTSIEENIASADLIFISVNTPTKAKGIGAGMASDLRYVEDCARQISKFANGHTIIVEKSTLPVRTAQTIQTILNSDINSKNKSNDSKSFSILSNPEFLSEGTAINDLEKPDRVLIGGNDEESIKSLVDIYSQWVEIDKIITTNLWSSELSKLISNAFLAQRVSSINSVALICQATGANIKEVSKAIGSDSRIGKHFLKPGPGFGGSCFKKDILNLVYLCNYFGLPEVASFWENIVKFNSWHKENLVKVIVQKLFGTLAGKKIIILGFAFKSNTNDTRESPSIFIVSQLLKEGANLFIHDPKVNKIQVKEELENFFSKNNNTNQSQDLSSFSNNWHFCNDLKNSFNDAHAVVILTEWKEYINLDWEEISEKVLNTAWLFDIRGILNKDNFENLNLNLWQIGTSPD
tara:strand:- start:421 stop:1854 length:1434 start_codon:yes stop_codon:yes gene_type:complete